MKDGWEIKKLGEVCESDLGKTLNQSKDTGELYPYLCAINIQWDRVDLSTVKQTKFEPSELERYSVRKGDLLICEGGDIGRAAIWNNEYPMLYQNALHRVRFNGEVHPKFCLSYLRHLKDCGVLDSRYGKGVTIKHLVKSSLLSIPIPIPPLPEQERIVSELDCINGILEKKREQIKELDALAQSIFYHMFGDPVTNEKGWEVKKLGEVCNLVKNGANIKQEKGAAGYPISRIETLSGGVFNRDRLGYANIFSLEKYQSYVLESGDLLLSHINSKSYIGRIVVYIKEGDEAIIHGMNLLRLKLKADIILPFFMYYYSLTNQYKDQIANRRKDAVNQSSIAICDLKTIPIPLPPLSLQQSFATKVEAIEKQKELIKRSIAEVETLLASRMQQYFG